jgi:hypothetical protein
MCTELVLYVLMTKPKGISNPKKKEAALDDDGEVLKKYIYL